MVIREEPGWELCVAYADGRWGHPWHWPRPPHRRPHWWQRSAKRKLATLEDAFGRLDNAALARFWTEHAKGQDIYEDAGGYLLRCYRAMYGLPVDPVYTLTDYLMDAGFAKGVSPDECDLKTKIAFGYFDPH